MHLAGHAGAFLLAQLFQAIPQRAKLLVMDAEILREACDEGSCESCEIDDDSVDGGWDEDDLSYLCDANLAAVLLANAFQRWPALLSDSSIQSRFAEIDRNLDKVMVGIRAFDPFDYTDGGELILPKLKAVLEAAMLRQSTPQKSRCKASAVTACRI
jgi:hypothetical protein